MTTAPLGDLALGSRRLDAVATKPLRGVERRIGAVESGGYLGDAGYEWRRAAVRPPFPNLRQVSAVAGSLREDDWQGGKACSVGISAA